jgi:hypothetical protein
MKRSNKKLEKYNQLNLTVEMKINFINLMIIYKNVVWLINQSYI